MVWEFLLYLAVFPARESLVSDIPAGDGKIYNFFTLYSLYLCAEGSLAKLGKYE
jgi:hypothetical protein